MGLCPTNYPEWHISSSHEWHRYTSIWRMGSNEQQGRNVWARKP
jgi:hypothetical protein